MTRREKMKDPLKTDLKLLARKMDVVVFIADRLIESHSYSEKEALVLDEVQMDTNNLLVKIRRLI